MSENNGHGDTELVPAVAGSPDVAESEYLITDEAEAWGLDFRTASHTEQKVWAEEEAVFRGLTYRRDH